MNLREAQREEVPAVQDLWRAFEAERPPPEWVPLDVEGELREVAGYVVDDDKLAIVAEQDGRLVAFALARLKGPRLGFLSDLYVAPQARRAGVATALAREVAAWVRARGADHLELEVEMSNAPARAAYEGWGMRATLLTLTASLDEIAPQLEPRVGETRGSVYVQTDDRPRIEQAAAEFLPRLGHSDQTEIAQPANGWIRIDDDLCSREPELLRRFARELSDRLGIVALSLGIEREVVRFVLFDRGRMMDEYLSVPEYFGELPPGDVVALAANPTVVARLTGADPGRVRAVARTARAPGELPPASELLRQIADVMGLAA